MELACCVNCSVEFNSIQQKHFTLHIVLPQDLISQNNEPQQQVLQAVEIPVVDTLKEIYNLRSLDEQGHGQEEKIGIGNNVNGKEVQGQLQVSVCTNCANMLANLYIAHKNFGQQRQANSFLSRHIELSKKRKILLVKVSTSSSSPHSNNVINNISKSMNESIIQVDNGHGNFVDPCKEITLGPVESETVPVISLDDDDDEDDGGDENGSLRMDMKYNQNHNQNQIDSQSIEISVEQCPDSEPHSISVPLMHIPMATTETEVEIPCPSETTILKLTSDHDNDPDSNSTRPFNTNDEFVGDHFNDGLLCEVKVEEFEQEELDSQLGGDFQVPSTVFLEEHQPLPQSQPQPQPQSQPPQAPPPTVTLQTLNPTRVFAVAASSLRTDKNVIGSQKRIESTNNICIAQPLLIASSIINPTIVPQIQRQIPLATATTFRQPPSIPVSIPTKHQAPAIITNPVSGPGTVVSTGPGPSSPPRINVLNLPSASNSALLLDDSLLGMNIGNVSKLKQIPLCRPGTTLEVSDPTRRIYVIPKGGPPFQCPDCPQMFMLPAVYRNHILAHIKKQEENGLSCKYCPGFRFETLHDLIAHHKYNHESDFVPQGHAQSQTQTPNHNQNQVQNPALRCEHPDCNYVASSTADSLHHSVYKHSRTSISVPVVRTRKEENDLIKLHLLRASMEVDMLEEKFPLKQDDKPDPLNTNMNSNSENNLKTFSIIFPDLTCHFTIADGPPYKCPFCSKPFSCVVNWSSLKKHITEIHLSILSGRTYNCKKCGKDFEKSSGLRNHRRRCGKPEMKKQRPIHPKIYKCDRCPRKFSSEKNKQVHLSHCGMQSFPCEICGLVFTRNCKLVSHMYKHATARPFICDQCGRSYKNKHGLSFHQKISHTEEGRLKYNELMRNKNRQRKLRKSEMMAAICKEEEDQGQSQDQEEHDEEEDGEQQEEDHEEDAQDEEDEEDEEGTEEEEDEMELEDQDQDQDDVVGF